MSLIVFDVVIDFTEPLPTCTLSPIVVPHSLTHSLARLFPSLPSVVLIGSCSLIGGVHQVEAHLTLTSVN
jgi:hypothetical protein